MIRSSPRDQELLTLEPLECALSVDHGRGKHRVRRLRRPLTDQSAQGLQRRVGRLHRLLLFSFVVALSNLTALRRSAPRSEGAGAASLRCSPSRTRACCTGGTVFERRPCSSLRSRRSSSTGSQVWPCI